MIINRVGRSLLAALVRTAIDFSRKPRSSEVRYLNLTQPPVGLVARVPQEEKRRINLLIDKKLQELEDSGLSREELLFQQAPRGLPLRLDPFFQFLKKNQLAREIYLRPNDEFTVQKVVDIALRQDIGPDPSYATSTAPGTKAGRFVSGESFDQLDRDRRESRELFRSKNFYSGEADEGLKDVVEELKSIEPIKYVEPVLSRRQNLEKYRRTLKDYDIHWRNIELLTQFLDKHGRLLPRTKTNLSRTQQKRVTSAIRTARAMLLIPNYGQVSPIFKRSLTSIFQQVQREVKREVSLETGHVVVTRKSHEARVEEATRQMDVETNFLRRPKMTTFKIWFDYQSPVDQQLAKLYASAAIHARSLKAAQLRAVGQDPIKLRKAYEAKENVLLKVFDRRTISLEDEEKLEGRKEQSEKDFNQLSSQVVGKGVSGFVEQFLKEKLSTG